jgi:hypothetical protein
MGGIVFGSGILVSTPLSSTGAISGDTQWRAGAGGNHDDIIFSPMPTSA